MVSPMTHVVTCATAAVARAAYIPNEQPDRVRTPTDVNGVEDGFESSATSGRVFTMKRFRKYTGPRQSPGRIAEYFARPEEESMCKRWAVLTSISQPTETVKQLGNMVGWCVVVVGDKTGPTEYVVPGVKYLSPDDQAALPYRIASVLPWNHFGRKNVGYVYAVHHGAKVIYDVDENSALIQPEEDLPHAEAAEEKKLLRFLGNESTVMHNPYPCFGGPGNIWPRGLSLEVVNRETSVPCHVVDDKENGESRRKEPRLLGVLQSLINHDPDVDAVYRMTYPEGGLHFDSDASPSMGEESPVRVIPDYSITPYNAQVKSSQDYLADFQEELPLYQQSDALASFLVDYRTAIGDKRSKGENFTSIMEHVEDLVVLMYEHGVLEEADVKLTQAWLHDLLAAGYTPPTPRGRDISIGADAHNGPEVEFTEGQTLVDHDTNPDSKQNQKDSRKLLVIAVPSIRADRRQKIRETWLKWGDDRVALRFFTEVGDDELFENSAKEIETYGDLVILDIQPGMNFGLKLLEAMSWMSEHFVFDFFLRLDDDYFLCLDRLLRELDYIQGAIWRGKKTPIYVGSLYCQRGGSRMDEAYMLLSGSLVDRVLNTEGLLCGGHGGISAGFWFTPGNSANKAGDVLWLHDPRLGLYENLLRMEKFAINKPDNTSVCKDHIGIHHAFAERVDILWSTAHEPKAAPTLESIKSLFDLTKNIRCPDLTKAGVSWRTFQHDDAQNCSSFVAHKGVHFGKEGRPGGH